MKTPECSSDEWERVADILRRIWADRAAVEQCIGRGFDRRLSLALDALLAEEDELIEQPGRRDDEAKA
jgi:hypothetical protein